MGTGNRDVETTALIDTHVTVLAGVSQIWDIGCRFSVMVAPYLTSPCSDVTDLPVPPNVAYFIDHDIAERPHRDDMAKLSTPFTSLLTWELDGAQLSLGLATDEILLAALGRTIARTIGDGIVAVDLQRMVGWFTSIYPVPLACETVQQASATTMLAAVHRTLAAIPNHGTEHELLQHDDATIALQLATGSPSDIFFSYVGTLPEPPSGEGPVQFDIETEMPVRETPPGLGHALQLRVYRIAGLLHLDWWYDSRRLDRSTVEELTEQFPLALIELTSEAIPLSMKPPNWL
jgi:phthiocerol/phenolphthiocerol synthesis type-I polyketide synthase E